MMMLLSSCLSLKEVNEYAATSVSSLNRLQEIKYSYDDYCKRDCELRQMRSGQIDTTYNCLCIPIAIKADSTIRQIQYTVTTYLQAIEQISNNQNFRYDVSPLTIAMQQNTYLKLSPSQTTTVTKAGNTLATAATVYYRKNQLKKYLEQADTVFAGLMQTFIYLLDSRLRVQLREDYETHFANQNQMLDNAKNDKGLKQFIIRQSLDERGYYLRHISLLDCYVSLLGKVKEGHHQLYLQRNHLNDKNIKQLAKRYADEVQGIASSVK